MLLKSDEPQERLIVALDVPTRAEALGIVGQLDGLVTFYKVGYQLFVAEGMSFVRELMERGLRVFLDLKMDDVDETISSAVREVARNVPLWAETRASTVPSPPQSTKKSASTKSTNVESRRSWPDAYAAPARVPCASW